MKPAEDRIRNYLRSLEHALWLRGLEDADTLAEVENHLRESVEQELERGLGPEEAEREAIRRFGPARRIAADFEKERIAPMQKVLLILAVLSGLFLAYLDSRPGWDATGILAGGLLLSAGLLTLLGYRRPWLIALAVGVWIPLHDIFLTHDFTMLFVLLFPFAGAYLGWAARLGARKMLHLT